VNNGLTAVAPLLLQPEYVARYSSPTDPTEEIVPSLVTTKSSQSMTFYHRSSPELFSQDITDFSVTLFRVE